MLALTATVTFTLAVRSAAAADGVSDGGPGSSPRPAATPSVPSGISIQNELVKIRRSLHTLKKEAARRQGGAAGRQPRQATVTSGPARPAGAGHQVRGGAAAVRFALRQLGKPYVWGATGPNAYDCSGLVQAAWRAAGVKIPRVTYGQYPASRRVSRGQLLPGDLVFTNGLRHVKMYIGNGRTIEAPRAGQRVKIKPLPTRGVVGYGRVAPTIRAQAGVKPAPRVEEPVHHAYPDPSPVTVDGARLGRPTVKAQPVGVSPASGKPCRRGRSAPEGANACARGRFQPSYHCLCLGCPACAPGKADKPVAGSRRPAARPPHRGQDVCLRSRMVVAPCRPCVIVGKYRRGDAGTGSASPNRAGPCAVRLGEPAASHASGAPSRHVKRLAGSWEDGSAPPGRSRATVERRRAEGTNVQLRHGRPAAERLDGQPSRNREARAVGGPPGGRIAA
ncbi:MAG: C40 family peptidase [Spirillospora sp.]